MIKNFKCNYLDKLLILGIRKVGVIVIAEEIRLKDLEINTISKEEMKMVDNAIKKGIIEIEIETEKEIEDTEIGIERKIGIIEIIEIDQKKEGIIGIGETENMMQRI